MALVPIIEEVKKKFSAIIAKHQLGGETVQVKIVPLSAEQAIGNPQRDDFPLLKGKEVVIEAQFRGSFGHAFTSQPGEFKGTIDEINHLASQIADLNLKIASAEVGGHGANDFRDKRNLLLKELSTKIGGSSFVDGDGNLTVMTGEGKPLVEGGKSWELSTAPNAVGNLDVFWTSSSGTTENITQVIESGELKGWIQTRDETIEDYLARLDTLAAGIIGAVNTLHTGGLDLNGAPGEASRGDEADCRARLRDHGHRHQWRRVRGTGRILQRHGLSTGQAVQRHGHHERDRPGRSVGAGHPENSGHGAQPYARASLLRLRGYRLV